MQGVRPSGLYFFTFQTTVLNPLRPPDIHACKQLVPKEKKRGIEN
jgi:hypothetical protein